MAQRDVAAQTSDHVDLVEVVADEAEAALGMEVLAVVSDDAGCFLSAMLQGVEAERGQRRGVLVAEDAEHPALFAKAIVFGRPAPRRSPRLTVVACNVHGGLLLRPEQQRYPGTAIGLRYSSSRGHHDIGQLARACHRHAQQNYYLVAKEGLAAVPVPSARRARGAAG